MSETLETKQLPPPTDFSQNLWDLAKKMANTTDTAVIFKIYSRLTNIIVFIHSEHSQVPSLAKTDPNHYNT